MTLGEIAAALGCALEGDGAIAVTSAAPIAEAGPDDIAYVRNSATARQMRSSKAGALIVPRGVAPDRPALVVDNPLYTLARVLEMLDPEPRPAPGVDKTAVIGEGVPLGGDIHIGPLVVIGDGAKIGGRVSIRAGAKVGAGCVIGEDSVIFENVTLYERTEIGARCRVHANTTLGADGYGYTRISTGEHYKIPQRGIVRLEDDVEIGANSSIDRATLGVTLIKRGVKIDNHVQIGHNCVIGEDTVIAGCCGVAGSVEIERDVTIGGMVGIADHVRIVSGAVIAGKSGVHTDIKEPGVYAGPMVMKNFEYKRFLLSGRRVEHLNKKVKELESILQDLQEKS